MKLPQYDPGISSADFHSQNHSIELPENWANNCSFIVALVALIVNLCKERNGTKKK